MRMMRRTFDGLDHFHGTSARFTSLDDIDIEDDATAELSYLDAEIDPESTKEWELDFWILEGRRFGSLCITLKDALASICDELGVPLPENIRFFRSQMQTIVMKACKELGIKPIPSKRKTVYMRHPGLQSPLLALDNPFPMELPGNLVGEKWAFVQLPFSCTWSLSITKLCSKGVRYFRSTRSVFRLPHRDSGFRVPFWLPRNSCIIIRLTLICKLSAVQEEAASLVRNKAFGADLDLDLLGNEIGEKTLVPRLAVASSRVRPLAGKI
ncbi:hypothetical protein GIB67_019393 [Kingdonia uniflora]|uniref:RNA-binding protein Tab2-like N-terminal domain-containing protein n=1 Tax=Kingdonia uniflora TaxID=39325 RepID=A0A7J7M1N2_9MAGN|nr:hypothetical protein GIB67_019393 [Kingdonia uniflora]